MSVGSYRGTRRPFGTLIGMGVSVCMSVGSFRSTIRPIGTSVGIRVVGCISVQISVVPGDLLSYQLVWGYLLPRNFDIQEIF